MNKNVNYSSKFDSRKDIYKNIELSFAVRPETMDLTMILLIICSLIGLIFSILIVIYLCKNCKAIQEHNNNQNVNHSNNMNLEVNNKIVVENEINQPKEIIPKIGDDEIANDELNHENISGISNVNLNIKDNRSSSVDIINENPIFSNSIPKENKYKDNYSFLNELIKSKINEIVIVSEKMIKNDVADQINKSTFQQEKEIFRYTEYSQAENSISNKHKDDIEDHKDISESDVSIGNQK